MSWDLAWVLWLNGLIGQSPQLFWAALFLSDRVPWVLSSMALIALWFAKGGVTEGIRHFDEEDPIYRQRIRVFAVLLAALLAFVVARPIAHAWARPRPFLVLPMQVPIDPAVWDRVVEALGRDGAFPSDHTAFWGALTAGLFVTSPLWGTVALLATTFFALLRVALGYHYPTDMVAGFWIGVLAFLLVYGLRRRMTWMTHPLLLLFEDRPSWAYAFALVLLLDITQRMAWFFGMMATLFGVYIRH